MRVVNSIWIGLSILGVVVANLVILSAHLALFYCLLSSTVC